VAILLFARAHSLMRRGQLEEARSLAEWLRDLALSGEQIEGAAVFGLLLGEILLAQGQPSSAARLFRESSGLFAERDMFGYRPWALSALARALALRGEVDEAVQALEEASRRRRGVRHYDLSFFRARAEVSLARGDLREAERTAHEGADWARSRGMPADEVLALDACISCVPRDADASRLSELADRVDSPLADALATRARGLVDRDPESLLDASRTCAAMSVWWVAADAALEAARILDRRHQARAAHAALRLSAEQASKCEGFRPSTPGPVLAPVRLTTRESQVARLAAGRQSNREIAAQMRLSLRTVENHLHRVFVKLGISDRSELADALGAADT
jgi:ATP/maltotriose-dependent transcriptional regulator MalT